MKVGQGGLMLDVEIIRTTKLTPKENLKVTKSEMLMELVINSPEFKQEILTADFSGETSQWKYSTNLEIYEHIMSGQEILRPRRDNKANIELATFKPNWYTRHIGHTYKTVLTQWINRQYLRARHYVKIASNILHEWGHKLGFDHDFENTARRKFSVCYRLNLIFEKLAPRYFAEVDAIFGAEPSPKPPRARSRRRWYKPWSWF